jgi:hypothetical protein
MTIVCLLSPPHFIIVIKILTEQMGFSNTHFSAATGLSFTKERGIGQGESASSLMWTALYDMLLTWIDPANRHLHTAKEDVNYSEADVAHTKRNAHLPECQTLRRCSN